jgi:mono/diheme cytochrome c family protein
MRFIPLCFVIAFLICTAPAAAQDKVQFNRDIRPILSNACFKCHGPAAKKGGVRLDDVSLATAPAKSGLTPVVPGKPGESSVIQRVFSDDPDEVMPPKSSHVTLKAAEKELLKRWIAEGAVFQKHWSFEAPTKVAVPNAGSGNPIDAFLVDRLRREKLSPSLEADRPTLIRRVAFATTGLPPTIAEVDQFLNDTSPDAYERMVDRYLASVRYGEEMARHWLDLARYADTHGLHLDNERQMWPYRDWVVRAFNSNMPFDRFTTEQLAGDQLPNPTRDQLVATGFNRCNVSTSEGGSIESEWVFRNAVDRTSTAMEVWLGLSGGCAVCHDHKFDPLTQKDYYSLYAFFYSAAGPALDGNVLLTDPTLKLPSPEQEKRQAELDAQIASAQKGIAERHQSLTYVDPVDVGDENYETLLMAVDPNQSLFTWTRKGDMKGVPDDVKNLLKNPKRDAAAQKRIREYYLETICTETKLQFEKLRSELNAATKERTVLAGSIPGTFIFKELPQPRESHVMMRGQYDKPGEKVEPNTPAALPPLVKSGKRATRLDLAKWLAASENPLTARVAVNRMWQQFFGIGIVRTASDFGVQGEVPVHPELLDFLAIRFRESGWDVKGMVRLMLTSQAFRQSAKVTPELVRRDPDNRLLARGPRVRLDAEQVRDNALFVSGLINLEIGGKGVKPYQPPRIWEPVAFTGSNTQNYSQDKGAALYRRSLYTFLKRTAPPPFFANFDAPNRESSCARRERSNTPLQALQLMNDVQHFEAARGLAQRMLAEGGPTPEDRIRFAYRTVLSRTPETQEADIVRQALQKYLDRYRADAAAAAKVIRVGESVPPANVPEPELAAYTLIANLILNLDETVMRN